MTRARPATRRDQAVNSALATPLLATKPISRACPKCEAPAGKPCRRWIAGRVCGQDIGGGYWKPLKSVHAERKNHRTTR
ncbi:hypothetical protein [Micromonospora tulbaghiae]|uniref:hypothetical protein n=1 Tax=Micromonospora tulbaghiae TaxID=479978 RepID=UPI0013C4D932|nr:hypothetical protein [Micromonospora tulbaghiae]